MSKLTEKQKKNIVAAYASGGVSYKALAKKYGVSDATISRIIASDPEYVRKCNEIKNEGEEESCKSLKDYFANNQTHAKKLISRLLDIPDELIAASTLRERVGAASYIRDMFIIDSASDAVDDTPADIEVVVEDASEGKE